MMDACTARVSSCTAMTVPGSASELSFTQTESTKPEAAVGASTAASWAAGSAPA